MIANYPTLFAALGFHGRNFITMKECSAPRDLTTEKKIDYLINFNFLLTCFIHSLAINSCPAGMG